MSVAAIDPTATAGTGAQSAIARIAELQQLVARAHGAQPVAATGAAARLDFSSVLAGAGVGQTIAAAAAATPTTAPAGPAVGATTTLGGEPSAFDGLIVASAQRYGVDPALLKGLIRAESDFDPDAGSSAGAGGLVQLMPSTAASLGVTDRFDPAQSIDGGARYLKQQLDAFGGDVAKALAAYNAGPGAVRRYDGVPPYAETQAYVQKVQQYAAEYRVAPVAASAPAAAPLFTSSIPTTGSGSIT